MSKVGLALDPLTGFSNIVVALCGLAEKAIDGQSPEQKQKIWAWIIEDIARWRRWFGLDEKKSERSSRSQQSR